MNKKLLIKIGGSIGAAALTTAIAYNAYLGSQKESKSLSDLNLANIEALATEADSEGTKCYNTITTKTSSKILYCGTCRYEKNSTDTWYSGSGKCKKINK